MIELLIMVFHYKGVGEGVEILLVLDGSHFNYLILESTCWGFGVLGFWVGGKNYFFDLWVSKAL